jgi:hypothetical protein
MNEQKFKDIFMDAAIVDFDLSQWDKRLRLIVVATEETHLANDGVLPMYAVDFDRISNLNLEIFHLEENVQGHYQWNATLQSIAASENAWVIELSSAPKLISVKISCKDVKITPVDKSVVDAVCPGWDEPRRPLARAGILEMAKLVRSN